MNLAGAQKLNESFFLVGEDAWFHQDNCEGGTLYKTETSTITVWH